MKIVGIDFGHGEISASYLDNDSKIVQNLKLVNTTSSVAECWKIPSYLYRYITADGNFAYTLDNPLGPFSLEMGLKKTISSMDDENKECYRIFIQLVYQRLKECNSELLHNNDFRLAIACPTKWSDAEKVAYKEFFEQALGIQVYAIMNESDAAFFAKYNKEDDRNNNILVVDYGSSTIDFTFVSKGKKVELDDLSSSHLGASCIEKAVLATYAADDSANNNYNAVYQHVNSILKEPAYGLDWINIDNFILKNIRGNKEELFTYRDQYLEEIKYIPYHNTGLNELKKDPSCRFKYELSDRLMDVKLVREYRENVKNQFIALKERIKQEGQIDKIIMSGGACMMSWVREDIKEVFDIDEDNILLDRAPAFVVCDGIVKYCQALAECIEKNKAEIDRIDLQKMMQESDVDTLNIISSRDIRKVMEEWKNNGNSIQNLLVNICTECYATYNSDNVTFVTEFKKQMSERITSKIQVIIKDIITKVFGNTDIKTDDYSYIHTSNLCYAYNQNNIYAIAHYLFKYIEDHVRNWDWSFVHFYELYTIDYGKSRTSSERGEVITTLSGDRFNWIFENIDSKIGITYKPIDAKDIKSIKDDILNYALRLMEEKQLFKTTFTR